MSSSSMFPKLPVEILSQIFWYCPEANDLAAITQTCRDWLVIARSTPSLWATIVLWPGSLQPEGPTFLRQRLQRAQSLPLDVTFNLNEPLVRDPTNLPIAKDLCSTLSDFNRQIALLTVFSDSAVGAGTIIDRIFPRPSRPYPNLTLLNVRLATDLGMYDFYNPLQLDKYLEDAGESFPMLETLSLGCYIDLTPIPKAPFRHLRTLILDGDNTESPDPVTVVSILYYTPQLEILWFKHHVFDSLGDGPELTDTSVPLYDVRRDHIVRRPVRLPHLSHLAISVPGPATDFLYNIEAPELEFLHLDGHRDDWEEEAGGFAWTPLHSTCVKNALKKFATHSSTVRYLAVGAAYLDEDGWEWILLGESGRLPFPELESISFLNIKRASGTVFCGISDNLFVAYSRHPRLPLTEFTFLGCKFALSGAILVDCFWRLVASLPSEDFEIVYSPECPQITSADVLELEKLGVELIWQDYEELSELKTDWWSYDATIDGLDSYAY